MLSCAVHHKIACIRQQPVMEVPLHFTCTPDMRRLHGTTEHGVGTKCSCALQASTTQLTLLCCVGSLQPKVKASATFSWEQLFIPG